MELRIPRRPRSMKRSQSWTISLPELLPAIRRDSQLGPDRDRSGVRDVVVFGDRVIEAGIATERLRDPPERVAPLDDIGLALLDRLFFDSAGRRGRAGRRFRCRLLE